MIMSEKNNKRPFWIILLILGAVGALSPYVYKKVLHFSISKKLKDKYLSQTLTVPITVPFPLLLVRLQASKTTILSIRFGLAINPKIQNKGEEVLQKKEMILSMVSNSLSSYRPEIIRKPEKKIEWKENIIKQLNEKLINDQISELYFEEFLIMEPGKN